MRRSFVWKLMAGVGLGVLLWALPDVAVAQASGTISGRVIESGSGRPLTGAEIFLEGRSRPAVTDANGEYTISNVPAGPATIRVRLIGYAAAGQTLTMRAGQTVTADFEIARSAISLDEIIVTGQGREVSQRKLTAPVDVINAQTIEETPVTDVAQLIQGQVAGATVNATSGQPGTSALINFRGVTSVFGSQTPVIYVDGIRVDNSTVTSSGTGGEESSAIAELITSDIERIEITKGGAASTLYGSDAASGVIQIFTKRGTPGAPRVTVRIEQGVDTPELKYMFDTGVIYPSEIEDGADPDFLKNNYFRTGHHQNYYVGVQGGGEDLTYSVSGRIQQADGVQLENDNQIYNLRGAVQADLSPRVNVNFTANYTRSVFERLYNGTAIADPLTSFEVGDVFFFSGEDNFQDALTVFTLPDINEAVNRFRFGAGANFLLSSVFTGRATIGLDYRTNTQREFSPIGAVIINAGNGSVQRFQRDFTSATGDISGTISYPNTGWLLSDLTFGVQGFREDISLTSVVGNDFALPGAPDFDEAANVVAVEGNSEVFNGGFYVQEEISLGDRFFINGGLRFDANSTFGDEVSVEAYPKAGAAYLISDEPFFLNTLGAFVNTLKLRVAYGQTGKFPTPYTRDRSFAATQFRGESAASFANPGNVDLGPEVTKTIETGFDIALLDNRVGVNFTYYDATTSDALFSVPEQPNTGLGNQLRNVGEITNTGIELEGTIQVLNTSDARWNLGFNYQAVKNEVTSLGGAAPFSIPGSGNQKRVEEGQPVGAWFVFTPIDTNGDGLLDGSEQQFSGSQPFPTKSGGLNTSLTLWNALTISGSADWATGHQVFDWGSIWATFNGIYRRELIDYEDQNGNGMRDTDADGNYTETGFDYPIRYNQNGDEVGRYSQNQARSAFLLDGDWLKLRDVSVRWSVPSSVYGRFGFDRATLYGTVRNVKIWSSTPMIDPELNGLSSGGNLQLGGESSVTLSPPRMWRFGLEVVF